MAATQFRDTFYSKAPPWLRTGIGEKYLYTLELARDVLVEKAYQAITIRFPGKGDVSQIPYLAFDRQLVQGPAEPNASFVARLTGAFEAWALAGSRVGLLAQLQAYLQNLQPGVLDTLPELAIVGGAHPAITTWDVVSFNTPSIALDNGLPAKTTKVPSNWNWDGREIPWRAWLILYMALVPTGQSGSTAQTGATDASACFTSPGHNVGGVWVPTTSGTPVNSPWLHVTHLAGLTVANEGEWLTLGGSTNPGNVGVFPIVTVLSTSECIVANPNGVAADAGPLTWSIGAYPYIGPGPVWGAPGYTLGQGELTPPPLDTGANVRGIWQPTLLASSSPTGSWGLDVSANTIQSIRQLVGGPGRGWKSASTFYESIIVAFDGGDGTPGNAYSPNSTPGSGNPDGTFGSRGKLVAGVWVPTRLVSSVFDCFCQGTGSWAACSVPNIT